MARLSRDINSYMAHEMPEIDNFFEMANNVTAKITRISVPGLRWNEMSNASIPMKTRSYQKAKKAAESYRMVNETTIVETEDGHPLVVFIKDGISKSFSSEYSDLLAKKADHFIRQLIDVNPPLLPSSKDKRRRERAEEEKHRWEIKGYLWGLVRT